MELNKKYKDINVIKLAVQNEEKIFENKIPDTWLAEFEEKQKEYSKYNKIYIILYELKKRTVENNIKIIFKDKFEGPLDNMYLLYPLLIWKNEDVLQIKLSNQYDETKLILETENKKQIENYLNEICDKWEDVFKIIKV